MRVSTHLEPGRCGGLGEGGARPSMDAWSARCPARLGEGAAAGPDHAGRHRADADQAWQASPEAAHEGGKTPEGRKAVADEAAHGVAAAARHLRAALGDGGGGADGAHRTMRSRATRI